MRDTLASATIAINSLATEKKQRGEHVFNFAAGDPILPPHPKVIEAVSNAIHSEKILYPPIAGIGKLRTVAAEWMNSRYGCSFQPSETLVTAGGKFALYAVLQLLLQPEDEVLITAPYWVSYPQIVSLFRGTSVIVPTKRENQWKLTPENLRKHLTSRSKILILNNACNPTGTLYSQEELEELLQIALNADLFVISDEVYSELVYDHNQFISCGRFAVCKEKLLVIQSCSKNFAMTGWRLGFAFGPESLIQKMTALQGQSTTGASTVSQWAALVALENHAEIAGWVKKTMEKRRNRFFDTLEELFGYAEERPPSSLYAFLPLSLFSLPEDSVQVSTDLLSQNNIASVPGIAFGQEGYLRFAFSETEEEIRAGLLHLKEALSK